VENSLKGVRAKSSQGLQKKECRKKKKETKKKEKKSDLTFRRRESQGVDRLKGYSQSALGRQKTHGSGGVGWTVRKIAVGRKEIIERKRKEKRKELKTAGNSRRGLRKFKKKEGGKPKINMKNALGEKGSKYSEGKWGSQGKGEWLRDKEVKREEKRPILKEGWWGQS